MSNKIIEFSRPNVWSNKFVITQKTLKRVLVMESTIVDVDLAKKLFKFIFILIAKLM